MKKKLGKGQHGSVAVIMAILLPVILGLTGLAIDVGNLVLTKTKLRNAVDAAIHAGVMKLQQSPRPTDDVIKKAVTDNLDSNGFKDVSHTINFNQDTVRNIHNYPEINITVTKSVATDFLGVFGDSLKSVNLTVTAEAVSPVNTLQPPFTYLLFSGSPTETLTMNGSSHDNGSIHANYKVNMNGSAVILGNVEGAKGVTMNGSESVSGYVQADTLADITIHGSEYIGGGKKIGATVIDMPDFSAEIKAATATADQYLSGHPRSPYYDGTNFTFNGSNVSGHTIYVEGNVTINGSCTWTGSILCVGGNITINGSSQIIGSNQMFLYAAPNKSGVGGNLTFNGSTAFGSTSASVIAYAPGIVPKSEPSGGTYAVGAIVPNKGTITVNGSSTWYGRVIGDTLTLNGSGNFDGTHVNNNEALPYGVSTGPTKPQMIM
ncbi:MAG: pilus assembly protein [Deltaproteobacteria bacterium]|nr:pilus assembly protein [Deltaproteobacteria bacterium]